MLRQASALAAHPDEFAPTPSARDASRDALAAFTLETPIASRPANRGPRFGPVRLRPVHVRVSNWIDHAGMAVVAVALSGMVIVVSAGPHEAAPQGTLTVTSEPAGAIVTVDGTRRGATPYSAPLATGAYRVDVGTGHPAWTFQMKVTAGGDAVLHVRFPVAPIAAATPSASDTMRAAAPAPGQERTVAPYTTASTSLKR